MDPRVERLHPAVEHLRGAGHGGHVGHWQPGVAQRPCRAPRRDQLEPAGHEATTQLDKACLVIHGEQRATRDRDARVRPIEVKRHVAPVDGEGFGEQQGDRPRQQTVLDGADPVVEGRDVVAGQDRHGLLDDDRAAVEGLVHEMDGAAGDGHAVGERVGDRVRARERGQQRRVGVQDPAVERAEHRRPDDAHVAGEGNDVRAHGLERRRQRRVVTTGDEGRLDPLLCRPVERPGAPGVQPGRASAMSPPTSPRPAAATSARRFEPPPETPAATRPATSAAARRALASLLPAATSTIPLRPTRL